MGGNRLFFPRTQDRLIDVTTAIQEAARNARAGSGSLGTGIGENLRGRDTGEIDGSEELSSESIQDAWREVYRIAGELRWSPDVWLGLSLKELVIAHDAHTLNAWDHTSAISAMIYNLRTVVIGVHSKRPPKPKNISDLHPYRRKERNQGMKITPDNFGVLRQVGNSMIGR